MDKGSSTGTSFDVNLASTLFPSLVELAEKSTLAQATEDDQDARRAKLALGKQANTLKQALIALSNQAAQLPDGSLSLQDQEWVIDQLEKELQQKRLALQKLRDAIPTTSTVENTADAMQTDS